MIETKKTSWFVLLVTVILISACQFLSDGGTEIPNELTGNLYLPGGTAASNAEVVLYPVDYLPGSGDSAKQKQTTQTNADGRFSFKGMTTGKYNVLGRIGLMDSLFSFSDSISISGSVKIASDTLKHPGSLTGKVQLRASDDLRTATVQVIGTDYSGPVDSTGTFVLKSVPQGTYQLQLTTTLADYSPSVKQVTIQSGQNDTLPEALVAYPKHFAPSGTTVALWTFDAYQGANPIQDFGPHGFNLAPSGNLSLEISPFGFAMVFSGTGQSLSVGNNRVLTVGGTGKITYEARVYLDQYPSVNNFNEAAFVTGLHEGLKLEITSDGSLIAGAQKQDLFGSAYLYAPVSAPGIVPLKRWVDVAVAVDQSKNQCYGYVDGKPVQMSVAFVNADPFQISTSAFTVGNDSKDNQPFIGKIDEIRVSNSLILGAGLPLVLK